MPMKRETGKDRWRRVPKDYFRTRDRLQGAKLQLSALAMVAALAWAALGVDWKARKFWADTDLNSLRGNHGTLARVHSAWAEKCDACHVPFEPIDGRALFASKSSASNRSSDKLCMSCHAGPSHHSAMIESEVKGCAECHRDHQGADFSLVRLVDGECTSCHSALDAHVDTAKKAPGSRLYAAKASRFNAQDHPAFTPDAAKRSGERLEDRGQLKFNHARHMMPGLVKTPGDTPYTAEQIPIEGERGRYQGSRTIQDPIQLDCASCHQLESTEVPTPSNLAVATTPSPVRSEGRYYLPVRFETSCRACHSLTFDPGMKGLEAPHGLQPDKVAEFLKQTYAAQVLEDDPKVLDVYVPAVRLPGKSPVEATVRKRRDDAVARALTFLFPAQLEAPQAGKTSNANNCLECHHYAPERSGDLPTKVEPTKVPVLWFTHAAFDHSAHRGVDCRQCHSRSYALNEDGKTLNPEASVVATDVLLPAIDNCVQCHAPAKSPGWFASGKSTPSGGASFDCTECHRYHNGDRPLQGIGATAQGASTQRSIAEFLEGTAAKSPPH